MILELGDRRWLDFVEDCSNALPFHHPAWSLLLAECYGYRPLALALTDSAGRLTVGVPILDVSGPLTGRRWVALPFTDYCPVLTRQGPAPGALTALMDEIMAQRLDRFELHAGLPEGAHCYTRVDAVRHSLALDGRSETIFGQFGRVHRSNIRKATRLGVQIKRGHRAADVHLFYRLHLLTRRRLGVPIQPRRLFDLLARRLIGRGLGFILTAHVDDTPVAAGLFLVWNGVLTYKYAASDPRFSQYRPNNLLTWAALRWACENGCHTFDWGRTDLHNRGLRAFKNGWGAMEEALPYSVMAHTPPRGSSHRVQDAVGHVIRCSPPWVCQAIGEYFYRYAG